MVHGVRVPMLQESLEEICVVDKVSVNCCYDDEIVPEDTTRILVLGKINEPYVFRAYFHFVNYPIVFFFNYPIVNYYYPFHIL